MEKISSIIEQPCKVLELGSYPGYYEDKHQAHSDGATGVDTQSPARFLTATNQHTIHTNIVNGVLRLVETGRDITEPGFFR